MSSESDHTDDACRALAELYDDATAIDELEELRPDEPIVETQTTVFSAIANEHRVQILDALRAGELCTCELQIVLDAPQSTVATHLRTLREAGLVKTRKKGRWTYYRIADTAVVELLEIAASIDVPTEE